MIILPWNSPNSPRYPCRRKSHHCRISSSEYKIFTHYKQRIIQECYGYRPPSLYAVMSQPTTTAALHLKQYLPTTIAANILITILIQAVYLKGYSHRCRKSYSVTHNSSKNNYRLLKSGWGNHGKVQVAVNRYLAT